MMQIGVCGMGRNGFMNQLMQSQEDADKIIKECEYLISIGFESSNAIQYACRQKNINLNGLTAADRKRIEKKVEEIYQSNHTRR